MSYFLQLLQFLFFVFIFYNRNTPKKDAALSSQFFMCHKYLIIMEIIVNVSKVLKHLLSILERNWTIFNVHINLHSFLFPRCLDLWGYIWTIKICCSKSIIAVGLTYRVRIREFVGRNLYTMGLPLMNTQKFCVIYISDVLYRYHNM